MPDSVLNLIVTGLLPTVVYPISLDGWRERKLKGTGSRLNACPLV